MTYIIYYNFYKYNNIFKIYVAFVLQHFPKNALYSFIGQKGLSFFESAAGFVRIEVWAPPYCGKMAKNLRLLDIQKSLPL